MLEILRQTSCERGLRFYALVAGAFGLALQSYLTWTGPDVEPPALIALTIVLATAGMIGPDAENGFLHILMARPISRNQYLAGRALGSLLIGVAWLACSVAATCAVRAIRIEPTSIEGTLLFHVNLFLALLWGWALLFLSSCVLPGYLDIAGVGAVLAAGASLTRLTTIQHPWLSGFGRFAGENLLNGLHFSELSPAGIEASDAVRYASNICIALLLGALIFNRREFSYGGE
jgi:hypothetical protein